MSFPARRSLAACALLLGATLAYVFLPPLLRTGPEIEFPVHRGLSARAIARELSRGGILTAETPFCVLARLTGADRKLQAGLYRLHPRLSLWQVLRRLTEGRSELITLRLPEGYTVRDVAREAGRLGVAPEEALLGLALGPAFAASLGVPGPSLEGYLYPETYRVPHGADPALLLELLVRQFRAMAGEDFDARARAVGRTPYEVVILASLVQKEAAGDFEMPRIAGVLVNRLARGMKLEVNASLNYVLESPRAWLSVEEMNRKSPYNTYRRRGLPPTPVCNPGKAALEAALSPEHHDFLFYVAPGEREPHVFARTYEEHLANVRRFRRAYR